MSIKRTRRQYFACCDMGEFIGPFTRYQAKKKTAALLRAGYVCCCVRGVTL